MKSVYILLICLIGISTNLWAKQVKIELNPENPVYNETFEVRFIIQTNSDDEPIISFDPLGVDVLDRTDLGTSTRITYINGESTIEKTVTVSYEMMAPRPGGVFLRNINVDVGNNKLTHPTYKINVLKQEKKSKDIFVRAEVDKESVFVGESIIVRYFLYTESSTPLTSMDIRKFPKLDKFLKRFHQEKIAPERVRFDGKLYVRRVMYTAQLFAEKAGNFKIDPISLKVQYGSRQNPFSGFGLNFPSGRSKSTTVSSKPLNIEVMSLPSEGMESHFSGLVGKHKFALKINKNKFIINEPIEMQLSVHGNGALELFEAPVLLKDQNIEAFEKTSDFQVNPDFTGSKKISYTYLGRGNIDLKDLTIPVSYFDPELRKYITEYIKVGDIQVAGGKRISQGKTVSDNNQNKKEICPENHSVGQELQSDDSHYFEPLYKPLNTFLFYSEELFYFFLIILLMLFIRCFYKFYKNRESKEIGTLDEILKSGVSYQRLHRFLFPAGDSTETMSDKIETLGLTGPCNEYFISLVETLNKNFAEDGPEHKLVVHKKYFKELDAAIRKNSIDADK